MRIYEIHTRAKYASFEQITDTELSRIAVLGFDAIWLMGVWQISKGATSISKIVSADFEGSPYAIPNYKINPNLGGLKSFEALVNRAHAVNLRVIVDFVSNHLSLDSPLIRKHPEYFIRSNPMVRHQNTGDYFLHKSGEVIAFGRDPFFPPWHDTAQLDYTSSGLRKRMIKVLKEISEIADGVRCDMAMLVLRDHIRQQWFPLAPAGWFDKRMPREFWYEAINEVKATKPDFVFIAESYWDKESELLELGFNLAYEKTLYDALVARDAAGVMARLSRSPFAMQRSLTFIENHDEQRAASVFDDDFNLAAAALILALPGSTLIYDGQMEGRKEKLPVQRLRPLTEEVDDLKLKAAYEQLLTATKGEVFARGDFQLFDTNVYGVVSFLRQMPERTVAYLGQIADAWHHLNSAPINLTASARAAGIQGNLLVTNLLTSQSVIVHEHHDAYHLLPSALGISNETRFCLLELAHASTDGALSVTEL